LQLEIQSVMGHTVITEQDMTDEEMRAKFDELIRLGYAPFADTKLDDPVQVKSYDEAAQDPKVRSIFLVGPQEGG
jgi:hypothetical protein